jgi:hypothetical protein
MIKYNLKINCDNKKKNKGSNLEASNMQGQDLN